MADKNARGSVFISYFKYVKYKWGTAGLQASVAELGFGPDKFKESEWYDIAMNDRILEWIAKKKGEQYVEDLGQFIVQDLGLLSYVVRFMSIESFLKKFQKNYEELFNYGSIKISFEGKTATVNIRDNAVSKYSCLVWLGSFQGMLKSTKTKGTVKKTKCQLKKGDHCEYWFKWD